MQPVSATPSPLSYPAAIFPARLEWLCQPEQIEQTLRLIYYLNFWKRAQQYLLYVDRLGLYTIQFLVLIHALKMGTVRATTYLDGTHHFPGELLIDSVAGNAARGVLAHLKELNNPEIWPPFTPEGDSVYQKYIRPLYKRITGQDYKYATSAVNALELARLRGHIQESLHKLIKQAQETHLPLPIRRLAALCIAPSDLLPMRGNRFHFMETCDSWKDLDISDQRKLDPEGYSEIVLQYTSSSAEFVFHLPFRQLEAFVPDEHLRELRRSPGTSQECGIYQGQTINNQESAAHPAREILQDLGVDISSVCPRELSDRITFLANLSGRNLLAASSLLEPEDWFDDPWDNMSLPPDLL